MQSVAQSSSSSSKTYRHTKTHSKWRRCDGKMSTDGASVRTLPNVTPVSAVLAHKASSNFVFQAHNARTVCGVVAVFVAELCYYLEARTFMVHSLRPMRIFLSSRAFFDSMCAHTLVRYWSAMHALLSRLVFMQRKTIISTSVCSRSKCTFNVSAFCKLGGIYV